ncbi:hypothetical protein ACJMK2_005418 [Sinanodonta woodiana]|uniref:G-protein coupled receptors family 1 profile domain-containing protein n=1 Tax=Sinanodonta woodiana TaxID=1069815 RepID=A0ABD3VQH7_SINWO
MAYNNHSRIPFVCDSDIEQQGDMLNLHERVVIGVGLAFLILTTICLNCVIIFRFICRAKHRMFTRIFLISLAASDLMVALSVMPFGIYGLFYNNIAIFGEQTCFIANSLDVMFTTTSIIHFSCLSLERYIAICRPFSYNKWFTVRNILVISLICWGFPLALSFGLISLNVHILDIEELSECAKRKGCILITNAPYAVIGSVCSFFLPSAFILWGNTQVYLTVKHRLHRDSSSEVPNISASDKNIRRTESTVARTIAAMTGCFFVLWAPFFTINIIDPFVNYSTSAAVIRSVTWLGYANSAINPIVYLLMERHTCIGRP